jgi:hypothetical protein
MHSVCRKFLTGLTKSEHVVFSFFVISNPASLSSLSQFDQNISCSTLSTNPAVYILRVHASIYKSHCKIFLGPYMKPYRRLSERIPHRTTALITPGPRRCRGFTITLRHTTLGSTPLKKVFNPMQRPLPDNTQHSKETDIHAPVGIRTRNSCILVDPDRAITGMAVGIPQHFPNYRTIWM